MTHHSLVGVGLVPANTSHYIDHLAVVCTIMDVPLMFLDDHEYQLAERYYPNLKIEKADYLNFTPEYLIANYDILYMSDIWNREKFKRTYQELEKQYNKRLRYLFCPHGFSDKGFYLKEAAYEDIVLIYGQNMLDLLKHYGVLEFLQDYVISGNYRYTYYKQNEKFYRQIVQQEILDKFQKAQKTILYAPTWQDQENSSSFFDCCRTLLDHLPAEYNMIVKLHPRLELDDAGQMFNIIGKYEDKGNIIFIKDFPPVYPLLAIADLYIGDVSSVGYDFLTFDRPLFFINKERRNSKTERAAFLFRCGTEIFPDQMANIYNIINEQLNQANDPYSMIRNEVYQYTFGHERPFSIIREDIERIIYHTH